MANRDDIGGELIRENFTGARSLGYLNVRYMTDWPPERPHEIVGIEG